MTGLKVGMQSVQKVYVGGVAAQKVYLGITQVWSSQLDPKSIAGLQVWLDGSDAVLGSTWPDKSGQAHHGNVVGSPAPVVAPNVLNGNSVVRFTANQGRIRRDGIGMPTSTEWRNYTIIYLARLIGVNTAPGRIFSGIYPTYTNFLIGYHSSGYICMYDSGWVKDAEAYPAWVTPWVCWTATASWDGTNYLVQFYKDGALKGQSGGGGGMGNGFGLSGYDPNGAQETSDCEVAELLIWNRRLSDAERQQVETYLRTKWGL